MQHLSVCLSICLYMFPVNTKVLFTAVSTKIMSVAAGETVVFDKVYTNIGGDYQEKTGEFVCTTVCIRLVQGVRKITHHVEQHCKLSSDHFIRPPSGFIDAMFPPQISTNANSPICVIFRTPRRVSLLIWLWTSMKQKDHGDVLYITV